MEQFESTNYDGSFEIMRNQMECLSLDNQTSVIVNNDDDDDITVMIRYNDVLDKISNFVNENHLSHDVYDFLYNKIFSSNSRIYQLIDSLFDEAVIDNILVNITPEELNPYKYYDNYDNYDNYHNYDKYESGDYEDFDDSSNDE
jgi:hypothetical protein